MPTYEFQCVAGCPTTIDVLTTMAKAEAVRITCTCGAMMQRKMSAPRLKADGAYSWRDTGGEK